MEEVDAAADPYLPYDGGGDTIPLQEIPRRGTPHAISVHLPLGSACVCVCVSVCLRCFTVELTFPSCGGVIDVVGLN